jgi:hypothetical protein
MVGKRLADLANGYWIGGFSVERGKWFVNCYRGDSKYRDFWLGC